MKTIHLQIKSGKVDASIPGNAGDAGSLFVDKEGMIRWKHQTTIDGVFVATFANVQSNNAAIWPFTSAEPAMKQLRVANGQTLDEKLRPDAPPYIKYKVAFEPTQPGTAPTPHDPMIIIRGGRQLAPLVVHAIVAATSVAVTIVAVATFLRPMICRGG